MNSQAIFNHKRADIRLQNDHIPFLRFGIVYTCKVRELLLTVQFFLSNIFYPDYPPFKKGRVRGGGGG